MKIKSLLAKPFASYVYRSVRKGMTTALADQDAILKELLKTGQRTEFGKEHQLERFLLTRNTGKPCPCATMRVSKSILNE
jgi:hypothetical protein